MRKMKSGKNAKLKRVSSSKNNKFFFGIKNFLFTKKKGFKGQEMPESIGMTLIFLLILVGLIMISFLVYIKLNFNIISGDPSAYSVNFVSVATKPFLLAEVLSHMKIIDRQILEQAIQTVATGSTENSNSIGLNGGLRILIKPYEFNYYRVGIEVKDDTLFETDNIETRCGEENSGWCTDTKIGCDVGYIVINDKDKCGTMADIGFLQCCTFNSAEYRNKGNNRGKYDIVTCSSKRGVCSEGEKFYENPSAFQCGEGQINLGKTDECKNANNGKTPFCCAERTDELEVATGVTTQAVVPLLYKDKTGNLEVEARSGSV